MLKYKRAGDCNETHRMMAPLRPRAVRQPRLTYPWPRPPVHADYDRTPGLSWAGQGSGIRRCTMMRLGWNGCAAEVQPCNVYSPLDNPRFQVR